MDIELKRRTVSTGIPTTKILSLNLLLYISNVIISSLKLSNVVIEI